MVRAPARGRPFVREGAVSAFPFDAVIFDMDGVLVDTEFYYQKELEKFIDYLQISVTRDELNAIVGSSHRDFQQVLVDWHERAGLGKLQRILFHKRIAVEDLVVLLPLGKRLTRMVLGLVVDLHTPR